MSGESKVEASRYPSSINRDSLFLLAELAFEEFTSWREAGLVRADTDIFELNECIVNATTGLISRQLSNDPGTPYDQGRHTPHWPALITAVVRSYLP